VTPALLGLTEESDAGVALVANGRLVFALNEERLTRRKLQAGFPRLSLDKAMIFAKAHGLTIDRVAVGGRIHVEPFGVSKRPTFPQRVLGALSTVGLAGSVVGTEAGIALTSALLRAMQAGRPARLAGELARFGLEKLPLEVFDHHACHGTSAYFTSGFDECVTITLDAAGDGYCSRVYACRDGGMRLLHSVPFFHSIGYYYTLAMLALGFKEGQQGKVTGLAARGNPTAALKIFEGKIPYDSKRMIFRNRGRYFFYELPALKRAIEGLSREDVSAGVQAHLERSVTAYVSDVLRRFGFSRTDLALAGGVFANVLLNQQLGELEQVGRVFIHPHMGDGGLAAGAAFALAAQSHTLRPYTLPDVYLGPDIDDETIREAVGRSTFPSTEHAHIELEIARLLADGRVVARYEGRMEYGPRALGHRSILCHAGDPHINDWLNKRLQRSEFMPFAPVVLDVDADRYFEMRGHHFPARFMTITCRATERCQRECPAVVHVDGTARPQIVWRETSPSYYDVLAEYKRLTGIGVLINTSFNMHEEPIVSSPDMAIQCFARGHLDHLAIGNVLISQPD